MSTPIGIDRLAIDALGWTLVHFVWQGALIALAFAALDRAMARAGASARYLVACGTLALMLALPAGTFVLLRDAAPRVASAPVRTEAVPPAVATPPVARLASERPAPPTPRRVAFARAARPVSWLAGTREALTRWTPSASRASWMPWLVAAWGIGVLALSIRLLGGWWLVRRWRNSVANAALPEWQPRLAALSCRLGVTRPVRLLRSAIVQVPTAIGCLRPVILLPASTLTGLSPAQIESILAHELAHIRRHDYLINLLQSLVETLLFYHPGVWWVSRRIREERELCCDDLAVGIAGDPVVYAEALCRLERLRGQSASLAVAASGGSLLSRIARLLGAQPRGHELRPRGLAVALGTVSVLALMTTPAATPPGSGVGVAAIAPFVPRASATTTVRRAPAALKARPAATCDGAEASLAAELAAASALTIPGIEPVIAGVVPRLLVGRAVAAAPPMISREGDDEPAEPSAPTHHGRLPYTVEEWIQLTHHGVDVETYARFEAAGLGQIPAGDLIALVDSGVEPDYVDGMRRGGLERMSAGDLIRLSQHGVTPEFVAGLRDVGAGDLSADELIRLTDNGVSPEWYSAMRWMGYPGLTTDKAIRLNAQGVSPEFASQLKVASRHRFSLDEIERMSVQGVSADYVARMEAVLPGIGSDDLIRLMQQGVEPDYVAQMEAAGRFRVDELIALYQQGVTSEYVFGLTASGYDRLTTAELIRLYQSGVTGEFAAEAAEAGHPKVSVSELIRLSQQGLPCKGDK